MKIAIIGGGISGFAIYLSLKKRLPQPPAPAPQHEYIIFEAYDTKSNPTLEHAPGETHSATLAVGGGIGLHPNGVRLLDRLNADLARDVKHAGHPVNVQKMISSYGRTLARLPCEHEGVASISLSRHALWKCLRKYIPESIIVTKRVSQVITNSEGRGFIRFDDGSEDVEADLIIGADGLKSQTRRALFPEAEDEPYPPQFKGLVGVGGMIQDETFKSLVEPGSLNFVFGGNGFFGYSFVQSLTPTNQHTETPQPQVTPTDTVMWWSTYEMESCPDPKTIDPAAVLRDLHARLENWKDPIIQKLLTKVKIQTVYPLYTTPELPIWSRDGVVLIGDAAHTLSPTTGQGTCQALEDVECFSMLLAYGLREKYKAVSSARDTSEVTSDDFASFLAQKERETITRVMQTHMKLRKPRIHAIQEKAKRFDSNKKNIGIVSEFLMYLALFIMGKLPAPSWMTDLWKYDMASVVEKKIRD